MTITEKGWFLVTDVKLNDFPGSSCGKRHDDEGTGGYCHRRDPKDTSNMRLKTTTITVANVQSLKKMEM